MMKIILIVAWMYAHPSDSLRMETLNGQAVVIHQVGEKETLYSLSRRYGAPLARILEFNPTADGGLEIGQLLKIPYTPKSRVQTADGTVHRVQPKETLFSISRMYNVSVDELKTWNNLKDNSLSVGQDVLVKRKATSAATPVVATEPKKVDTRLGETKSVRMTHTVAPGETLYGISRMYSVSLDQLRTWNGLTSNDVKLSQVLYIAQPMFQFTESTPKQTTEVPKGQDTRSTQVVRQEPVVNTPTPVAGSPVKISESVLGTDEVHELGLAELIEGTEGNRKYLALHRTAKEGSILKIRNELNNREVFVRVAGSLPNTGVNDKLVIKLSKSAYDRLGAIDSRFRVEVTYYK